MSKEFGLTRRQFLKAAGATGAAILLTACEGDSEPIAPDKSLTRDFAFRDGLPQGGYWLQTKELPSNAPSLKVVTWSAENPKDKLTVKLLGIINLAKVPFGIVTLPNSQDKYLTRIGPAFSGETEADILAKYSKLVQAGNGAVDAAGNIRIPNINLASPTNTKTPTITFESQASSQVFFEYKVIPEGNKALLTGYKAVGIEPRVSDDHKIWLSVIKGPYKSTNDPQLATSTLSYRVNERGEAEETGGNIRIMLRNNFYTEDQSAIISLPRSRAQVLHFLAVLNPDNQDAIRAYDTEFVNLVASWAKYKADQEKWVAKNPKVTPTATTTPKVETTSVASGKEDGWTTVVPTAVSIVVTALGIGAGFEIYRRGRIIDSLRAENGALWAQQEKSEKTKASAIAELRKKDDELAASKTREAELEKENRIMQYLNGLASPHTNSSPESSGKTDSNTREAE